MIRTVFDIDINTVKNKISYILALLIFIFSCLLFQIGLDVISNNILVIQNSYKLLKEHDGMLYITLKKDLLISYFLWIFSFLGFIVSFTVARSCYKRNSKKTLQKNEYVAVLEAALADSKAEADKLRERVAELENAPLQGDWDDIPYTLWREVLAMREAGMTDKQIAVKLNDKGQGIYQSQLGALLYTGKEKMPTGKTLQENAAKLFR